MSSDKKIAFVCGMNNNFFSVVRYLRDRGVDCDLLLTDDEAEHFLPYNDTFNTDYMGFTRQLTWGSARVFLGTSTKTILRDLKQYNVIVGCGLAPAYCARAGLKLDIFVPYGGDIWISTAYQIVSPHILPSVWAAAYWQKKGIGKCGIIHMLRAKFYENKISHLMSKSSVRWIDPFPLIYVPEYETENAGKTHWEHLFAQVRNESDFLVVSHSRFVFGNSDMPSAKGQDILLRGWRDFIKRSGVRKSKLILLEYGPDVQRAKQLAIELKIQDSIVWFPKMARKDIMIGLKFVDLVCGSFKHSWLQNGVLTEGMAAAKPILTYRDDSSMTEYPKLYPIYNAHDRETVSQCLMDCANNPEKAMKMGIEARKWYDEEVVEKAISKYINYFNSANSE